MSKQTEPTPETPAEDIEAKRAALLAQLADLPPSPQITGLRPGTVVGEGVAAEKVPFTTEYFLDLPARQKEDPNYRLHDVDSPKTLDIKVQGVSFTVIGGRVCQLPTPHYLVYRNHMDSFRKHDEEYAKPTSAPSGPGYISPVHLMGGVWSKTENQS